MPRVLTESHIVMVDDNEGDIYIARRCLAKSKLTNPWLSFTSGVSFLRYLTDVKAARYPMPAIVLLDINMPAMSGFEVLEQTRSDAYFAELPMFCMLSGSNDPRDEERAMTLGASGFITKPGSVDAFVGFFNGLA